MKGGWGAMGLLNLKKSKEFIIKKKKLVQYSRQYAILYRKARLRRGTTYYPPLRERPYRMPQMYPKNRPRPAIQTAYTVNIPNRVEIIGEGAFRFCSFITAVNIPKGVTHIERQAFMYCTNLRRIVLPDTVTTIGEAAFIGCNSLFSIVIPDSVTEISADAFDECTSLETIYINVNKLHMLEDSETTLKAGIYGCLRSPSCNLDELPDDCTMSKHVSSYANEFCDEFKDDPRVIKYMTRIKAITVETAQSIFEKCRNTETKAILINYISENAPCHFSRYTID